MIDEQLEFQISQYLDGSLPASQRAALDERLARDVEAQRLLDEYRRLDAALKSSLPLPDVRWDRLAAHLSDAVAREQVPAQSYSLPLVSMRRLAALAAAVALAAGIFFLAQDRGTTDQMAGPNDPLQGTAPLAIVAGPSITAPAEPPVQQIAIGASPSLAGAANARHTAEIIVSRPPSILIASSGKSAQDTLPTLY